MKENNMKNHDSAERLEHHHPKLQKAVDQVLLGTCPAECALLNAACSTMLGGIAREDLRRILHTLFVEHAETAVIAEGQVFENWEDVRTEQWEVCLEGELEEGPYILSLVVEKRTMIPVGTAFHICEDPDDCEWCWGMWLDNHNTDASGPKRCPEVEEVFKRLWERAGEKFPSVKALGELAQ